MPLDSDLIHVLPFSLHQIQSNCLSAVLDMKPLEVSQPGSRLSDSPAPPCVQQDIKIKQEPKTPIATKKTQVSVTREDGADSFGCFVTHIVFNSYLISSSRT